MGNKRVRGVSQSTFLKNQETGSETERGRERNWMDLRELVGSIERGIGELT
jgi:hypothetical protein